MIDLIKKMISTGIGLGLKTWDEVETVAKELVEKGKMSEKEGSKFIKDLQKKYEDSQKKFEARVEKSTKEFLKRADVVTGDDLKVLEREIKELKKMISTKSKKS